MNRLSRLLAGALLATGTLAFQPPALAHGGGFGHWPGDSGNWPGYGYGRPWYRPPACRLHPGRGYHDHHDYGYRTYRWYDRHRHQQDRHHHKRERHHGRHHDRHDDGHRHHTGYARVIFY